MNEVASWQSDILGPGYEMMTLGMGRDYEGEVIATLVRRQSDLEGRRAVLYVHGYNDYFFQKHLADFYTSLGITFYALDLRKYGRSLLPHQTANLCRSVQEYYPEIDIAVDIIKRDGHEMVLVSGHSTGGLIVSLWADEGNNRDRVGALILNSPNLSSGAPVAARFTIDPVCRMIARRNPAAAFPLRLSPRYARSLHRCYQGEWDFNTAWKSVNGTLLMPAWLASIHQGQRRVRKGLCIRVPVLVLCGTASGNRKTPSSDLLAADIVLDVRQIAQLSTKLSQNVTCIRIAGAIHDVFLSPLAVRHRAFGELSNWLGAYAPDPRDFQCRRLPVLSGESSAAPPPAPSAPSAPDRIRGRDRFVLVFVRLVSVYTRPAAGARWVHPPGAPAGRRQAPGQTITPDRGGHQMTPTLQRRVQATSFLRHAPVLAALPEKLLEQLAGLVREVQVPAGSWILREGDPADSMFIVASGRVEVIREGPPETLLRVLRRGDLIGELALLQEGVRSASARAQRDSELLELGRAEFESLIECVPSFATGMARALAAQVAVSSGQCVSGRPPRMIAVVGLDGAAPTAEVGETLADALGAHGSTVRLLSGDVPSIARAEQCSQRVVLVAPGHPREEWTRLCLSEADVVLAVSTGRPDPAWMMQVSALRGCELLAMGAAADEETLQILRPREVQVVAEHPARKRALDALARRLAGQALGIVLSGGGARALAHIGVLEELRAGGLHFDRVAGVSMGALIAALAAMGLDGEEVYDVCLRGLVKKNPTGDFTLPAYSFIRGARTRRLLHEVFGDRRIEELPLRFFSLSCDLVRREAVVHRTGRLFDAVYPSLAIPGVFPPVSDGGRLLVDGAVLDNLPASAMADRGDGPVIAVDATGPQRQLKPAQRPLQARLGRSARRALTGSEHTIPRFTETIVRSMTVGSANSAAAADLVITPAIEGIGLLDWKAIDRMRELGRDAARKALDADPGLLARLGI